MDKKMMMILVCCFLLSACGSALAPTQQAADPFLEVAIAQRTAEAAQAKAEALSAGLTATAEAPIMAITSTAAQLIVDQQYWTATAQSASTQTAAPLTETARAWTATPSSTPTVNATGTLVVEKMMLEIDQMQRQRERSATTNQLYALAPYVVGGLFLALAWKFISMMVRRYGVMTIPLDGRGNPHPMLDVVDGVAFDADRMANAAIVTRRKDVIRLLPPVTADRQDAVTRDDQAIDLRTRSATLRRISDQLPKALPEVAPAIVEADDVSLPDWSQIENWDGKSLPLGVGRSGLITAQAASPHILVAGKTGSGKTLYMLRTLITASLAKGEQVINLGYSDSGFGVFGSHPNYHSMKLEQAGDIIPCLQNVYRELRARMDMIGGSSMDWDHWRDGTPPLPFVRIVMDELGNMAEDLYLSDGQNATRDLWRWVAMIANEGRKVGLRFAAALQDPTARSMDLRFRRNCTLVAFQQGDAAQSTAFLGTTGAEQLQIGRFMARVDGVTIGGGFAPTDEQIMQYLNNHSAPIVGKPQWLAFEDVPQPRLINDPSSEIEILAESIRDQWQAGMSGTFVATKLLGLSQYGGAHKTKTDKVISYLISTTTTPKVPGNGLVEPRSSVVGVPA